MPKTTVKVLDLLRKVLPDDSEIVLLSGSDEYLHDLVLKKLEAEHVDPDFRDFNFRKLDCTKSTQAYFRIFI